MLGLWNQEWLGVNSQRKYPLADDANGISDSGSFVIPDDFIVELDLAVQAGDDVTPGRFFLLNIGAYASGYSVIIGYQPADDSAPVPVATALIARQLHTRNRMYALGGIAPFTDVVGKVVIGSLGSADAQAPGFHAFTLTSSRLDPDAIRPIIRGVSSITVINNGQRSQPLYGDIELVAGSNCQLVPILVSGQPPTIQFNAIRGEGTVTDCVCVGDAASAPPITRINGTSPTGLGDFTLVGDDCLQITPITNGLQVTDKCSKPCCGCTDLEAITRDLERLRSEAATVSSFVGQVKSSVDTMNLLVLGARLGNQSCFSS